jgi:hypothetical protein
MVGKTPDTLMELKALVIQLDEECMGTDHHETQTTSNHTTTTDSNKTTCHATLSVKAEVTCIRTSLSADNQAQYLQEGCCFGCGKPGHHHPKCPNRRPASGDPKKTGPISQEYDYLWNIVPDLIYSTMSGI